MKKHWLKQYDKAVPHSLKPYPERTLLDAVREAAAQRPNHPALLFKGASLSCGELDRLSDKLRAPLELKYAGGLTNRQIADALGISVSNVKVRVARAKDLLQARLGERTEA